MKTHKNYLATYELKAISDILSTEVIEVHIRVINDQPIKHNETSPFEHNVEIFEKLAEHIR